MLAFCRLIHFSVCESVYFLVAVCLGVLGVFFLVFFFVFVFITKLFDINGQRHRVDIRALVRTAHDDLPQKRLEKDLCC